MVKSGHPAALFHPTPYRCAILRTLASREMGEVKCMSILHRDYQWVLVERMRSIPMAAYPVRQRGQADGARQTPFLERFTYFQNTNSSGIIL